MDNFQSSVRYAKTINKTLHSNMMEAAEKRADALFANAGIPLNAGITDVKSPCPVNRNSSNRRSSTAHRGGNVQFSDFGNHRKNSKKKRQVSDKGVIEETEEADEGE